MRTLVVGAPRPRQLAMHAACRGGAAAAEASSPGTPMGEVFDAQAAVLDPTACGPPLQRLRLLARHRLRALLDGLADVLPGNPVEVAPGMVFFLHMILMDSEAGLAMTLGRTSLITAAAPSRSRARPLDSSCLSAALLALFVLRPAARPARHPLALRRRAGPRSRDRRRGVAFGARAC